MAPAPDSSEVEQVIAELDGVVEVADVAFPRTGVNKISKAALRDLLAGTRRGLNRR